MMLCRENQRHAPQRIRNQSILSEYPQVLLRITDFSGVNFEADLMTLSAISSDCLRSFNQM